MAGCEVEVDLSAVAHNVAALRSLSTAEVMAVVKADGYGHGLVPSARAALAGGATWLGVAHVSEALGLRAAGVAAPVLCWLLVPGGAVAAAVAAGVDISVSARWMLDEAITATRRCGRRARVHLKVDTGGGRGGATEADWPDLLLAAAKSAGDEVEIVGVWSHLGNADRPGDPRTTQQLESFAAALRVAATHGVVPQIRHLANSAATLTLPAASYDLVRPGIAMYGVNPVPVAPPVELVPAMTWRAPVVFTHRLPAGSARPGRSLVTRERTVALVAAGYADGVPRGTGQRLAVWLAGRSRRVRGEVDMDQFMVDVGDAPVVAGDVAVLFGPGGHGEPTVVDWARAAGTIPNEILTRISSRVRRVYR